MSRQRINFGASRNQASSAYKHRYSFVPYSDGRLLYKTQRISCYILLVSYQEHMEPFLLTRGLGGDVAYFVCRHQAFGTHLKIHLEVVASGHHVVVVDNLDESL
eukprot:8044229-Pyramimonas_sp.AAC.2